MLPTDAARNSGMPYEMRAGHVWTDSPAYKGEQVDDLENLCFGIFVDYDGELIDLDNDKGTQCVMQYSKKPSYTTR